MCVLQLGRLVRGCYSLRDSFVGELGWELHIPSESCVPVYQALHQVGQKYGLVNAGYRAIDSLSMEKGYPHWHQEVRMDDSPVEAGLMFTCKLKTDTDFLGRAALEQKRAVGARKKKVCFSQALCVRNGSQAYLGWT